MNHSKNSKGPTGRRSSKFLPKRLSWITLAFVAIAVISGGLGASLALVMTSRPLQKKLPGTDLFQGGDASITAATVGLPELTRPVNILLMGTIVLTSDLPNAKPQPPGQYLAQVDTNLNGLSDSILLLRFDPQGKKLNMLSIPRDSRVDIPGVGMRKINAANELGGASLAAQTVSQLLGNVAIDRYIRVNVAGFGKLIDALGGVDIYVPKRMKYQDDSQHLYINLSPGQQHLDGKKAIQYMRFRYDDLGDIGRVQRQQTLIRALMEQKLNLATVSRLPNILAVLKENIDTNLSLEEILALGGFATKVDRRHTPMLLVPGRFSLPGEFPLSYWIVDELKALRLMAEHFGLPVTNLAPEEKSPRSLRVAIQDSVKKPQGVSKATKVLSAAGFEQVFPAGESWAVPLLKTQIVAQQGDAESAERVRAVLGIGEVVTESTGILESDVTVRLGRDWVPQSTKPVSKPTLLPDSTSR